MITNILVNVLGAVVFLFIFWKKLREDYISEQIFTAAVYLILGIGLGVGVSLSVFPDYWFWASVFMVSLALLIGMRRFHLRFYETVEASVLAFLPWLALVFLWHAIVSKSVTSFLGSLFLFGLIGLFWYLDNHYRKFAWYKSGRIGFVGMTTLGVFFLARTAVAPFADSVLSFAGKYDVFASGFISLGTFLLLLKLSQSE